MKNEQVGIEVAVGHGTIKNIVDAVDLIIGDSVTTPPVWVSRQGDLEPRYFNGYNFFSVSKLVVPLSSELSDRSVTVVRLCRPSDIGKKTFEYRIEQKKGELELDKYMTIWTSQDEKELQERIKRKKSNDPEEKRKAEVEEELLSNFRRRAMALEKATGFSFVSENDASFLLEILGKLI